MKDSYTGKEIPLGSGFTLYKKDGTPLHFLNQKSYKNFLMKRKPLWVSKKKKTTSK
ncbi:hypothetical protein HUU53_00725 [Candidatus Micrarchaeota archaeon]|nr:hypothetical protein [Candidatus Micrarchaeota archaeon]